MTEITPNYASWEERVHPDDLPAMREAFNAHLESRPFLRNANTGSSIRIPLGLVRPKAGDRARPARTPPPRDAPRRSAGHR
ncbi:MAG: hypothetical protein IPL59_23695 [Candidatus Competibacteraceae bacterium]|nr:hypothetical protein [Candidatus Competibacteraceae bacterium]